MLLLAEERSAALKAFSLAAGLMRRSGAYQQSIQHKSTAFAPKMPEVRSAATPSPALALPVPVPVAMLNCSNPFTGMFASCVRQLKLRLRFMRATSSCPSCATKIIKCLK